MKIQRSAFYNDAIHLTLRDIFLLLIGKTIKSSSIVIACYKMPSNGCNCAECRISRMNH